MRSSSELGSPRSVRRPAAGVQLREQPEHDQAQIEPHPPAGPVDEPDVDRIRTGYAFEGVALDRWAYDAGSGTQLDAIVSSELVRTITGTCASAIV